MRHQSPEQERVEQAAKELRDCPIVEVSGWCDMGQEHYHPDCGEYWKPAHIHVYADMSDMAVLRVMSAVMDKYGLKVHVHHGIQECNEEWARLVPDYSV